MKAPRLLAAPLLAAVAMAFVPAAQSHPLANPIINVQFFATGAITVSLADGAPLGVTNGSPTVIPAGFYTVNETGPGGCSVMPHWQVNGPGVQISDNLTEGEVGNESYTVVLQPSSTYTWRSDAAPGVLHTFVTSTATVGAAPPVGPIQSSKHTVGSSSTLIGSAIVRASLKGAVDASGKVTVSKTKLAPGRYRFTVTDASKHAGFVLKGGSKTVTVTGPAFVGKHAQTVTLTAGRWTVGSTVLVVH